MLKLLSLLMLWFVFYILQKELEKEEIISRLLLQPSRDSVAYSSGEFSRYYRPVVAGGNGQLSTEMCMETHAHNQGHNVSNEPPTMLECRNNDTGRSLNCVTEQDDSFNSPENETDARISSIYAVPDTSLARIHRSKSRQKARELSSAKVGTWSQRLQREVEDQPTCFSDSQGFRVHIRRDSIHCDLEVPENNLRSIGESASLLSSEKIHGSHSNGIQSCDKEVYHGMVCDLSEETESLHKLQAPEVFPFWERSASSSSSSGKRLSSNPELTCFPIEEDPGSNEENENAEESDELREKIFSRVANEVQIQHPITVSTDMKIAKRENDEEVVVVSRMKDELAERASKYEEENRTSSMATRASSRGIS